jgi:hypothetical protein
VAFCDEGRTPWVVDKRTCWSEDYGRTPEAAGALLRDVRTGARGIGALDAYDGFSLEVLRAPDPSAYYAHPRETTAWCLQQVSDSSSRITVAEYLRSLGLQD